METSDHSKNREKPKSQKSRTNHQNIKKVKKKLSFLLFAIPCSIFAQSNVEVKTVDLNANGKSKTSKIVKASYDNENGAKLTFVNINCDGNTSVGGSSVTFSAKELDYDFEHLLFDKDFNFKNIEKEKIYGLNNTLPKYPVLGQDYLINSIFHYLPGANAKGGWLDQYSLGVKTIAMDKGAYFACDQKIVPQKESVQISFPSESILFSHSTMEGVYLLTQNSQSETTVNVRYFDHSGNQKQNSSFSFNYGMCSKVNVLKNENGGLDLIVIAQPTDKYSKYGIKIDKIKSNPLEFEYIRIDGSNLKLKERFTFSALSTQWYPESVIENNGAVYVLGSASKKVKLSEYHFGGIMTTEGSSFQNWLRIDELENYQFIKIKGGKAEYVKSYTPDQMINSQSLVNGSKGSNNPNGYFRLQEIKILYDKLFITGQNSSMGKDGDERKQEFMMLIDDKGELNKLFFVPKSNYSNSNMFFSPDNKSVYWAIYDYSNYTVRASKSIPVQVIAGGFLIGGDDRIITSKRKIDDGPLLQIVKIDLTNNTAGDLETFGKDEYTLFDECKILYSNETEVTFLGLSGNVKDRTAKIIRLKL